MRILSGIFDAVYCKIDEILMSFFPWFSLWYCLFGFLFKSSQLSSQVFAKHCFASVSINENAFIFCTALRLHQIFFQSDFDVQFFRIINLYFS